MYHKRLACEKNVTQVSDLNLKFELDENKNQKSKIKNQKRIYSY